MQTVFSVSRKVKKNIFKIICIAFCDNSGSDLGSKIYSDLHKIFNFGKGLFHQHMHLIFLSEEDIFENKSKFDKFCLVFKAPVGKNHEDCNFCFFISQLHQRKY